MRKPRSSPGWSRLAGPQRELAEKWLFEGQMNYEQISFRLKTEFEAEISADSVGRYYRRRSLEQARETKEVLSLAVAKMLAPQVRQSQGESKRSAEKQDKNADKCGWKWILIARPPPFRVLKMNLA